MANTEGICKARQVYPKESVNYEVISTFWLHKELSLWRNLVTELSEGWDGAREAYLGDSLAPTFFVDNFLSIIIKK